MSTEAKEHLVSILKPFLKDKGYRKRGATWSKEADQTIMVINTQCSSWSLNFYINLGIYIKAIGDKQKPSESDCHLRNRLEDLFEKDEYLLNLLNYQDYGIEDQDRTQICQMLEERGIPWLEQCSTLHGAKEAYLKNPRQVLVKWHRDLLDELFA